MEEEINYSSKSSRSSNWVPLDLWIKVFILLPVRDLVVLRAVCKLFLSGIDDPQFVTSHLRRFSGNVQETRILTLEQLPSSPKFLYQVRQINKFPVPDTITEQINEPGLEGKSLYLAGSLNGLLLVLTIHPTLNALLWNPSIRKLRRLCPPSSERMVLFALGHVAASVNDYKVLATSACREEACIYSVNSGSWTEIEISNSGFRLGQFGDKTAYSERLRLRLEDADAVVWIEGRAPKLSQLQCSFGAYLSRDSPNFTHRLVWFGFGNCKFRYAEMMPYSVDPQHECVPNGLLMLDGGSSVGVFGIDGDDDTCGSVWALQTDTMSWIVRYRIALNALPGGVHMTNVSLHERDGELVWKLWDEYRRILVYSYHTKKRKIWRFMPIVSTLEYECVDFYFESLVMLNH